MADLPKVDPGPSPPNEESIAKDAPKTTEPQLRYPPFPPKPPGVDIIPFKSFKEHGILIFSPINVEIDGLGIPTVPLRVPHATDQRKTQTKDKPADDQKPNEHKESMNAKGKGKEGLKVKMDPLAKAQEQRRQRILMFARKEWYNVWAEGEDLRGIRTYDASRSPIDRIHLASTEFRISRMWPPASSQVPYLWDQFRLYAGLLGSPPVWIRTDLPQSEEDSEDDEDDETDSDIAISKLHKSKVAKHSDSDEDSMEDSDDDDDFSEFPPPKQKHNTKDAVDVVNQAMGKGQPNKKRIPPRTPYALYNLDPIPVSSDIEVRKLLSLSVAKRETRLLKFLADPDYSTRVFLSWYLRHEGLVWSPIHLVSLPHLLSFFLAFLIRVKALPESERSLKKAIEVAKRAIVELPRTGKLCRELPDKFGAGSQSIWGKRWVDTKWNFVVEQETAPDEITETQEEAMKRFEEELRAANVQILSADPVQLGVPSTELDAVSEVAKDEILINDDAATNAAIALEVQPLQSGAINDIGSTSKATNIVKMGGSALIEEVAFPIGLEGGPTYPPETAPTGADSLSDSKLGETVSPSQSATVETAKDHSSDQSNWAATSSQVGEVPSLDWSTPTGVSNPSDIEAARNAWSYPTTQPLMELFGMTVFPLRYEAGVAERSMRKVKAILKPGEVDKDKKLRGVDEDLASRLSRVVMTPWIGWEEGDVAPEYRSPQVQHPPSTASSQSSTGDDNGDQDHKEKSAHDPQTDDITVLMEPRLAEMVSVGMGMAGTWVQILPVRDQSSRSYNERGRGHGRGRGRAIGAGQGRVRTEDENAPEDGSAPASTTDGRRGSFRGRSRGRGNPSKGSAPGGGLQKDFTFWYVEDMHMIIPSFWTVGEVEQHITQQDLEEALEMDIEGD